MDLAEQRNRCPVCSAEVINLSHVSGGRPRLYCSVRCRREVERRRKSVLAAQRRAERLANLPPEEKEALQAFFGATTYAEYIEAAETLLGQAREPAGRTTGSDFSRHREEF